MGGASSTTQDLPEISPNEREFIFIPYVASLSGMRKKSEFWKKNMGLVAKFPAECIEDIFRHLLVKEVFTCTLVCPSWNEFIGSTVSCMENVYLRCSEPAGLEAVKKILKSSKRKYRCLKIKEISKQVHLEELQELLSFNGQTWNCITAAVHFETVSDFLELLRSIPNGIRKLDLNGCSLYTKSDPNKISFNLQFPNLKFLSLSHNLVRYYDKTFVSCKSLESLDIVLYDPIPKSALNVIASCLKSNKGLKTLQIYCQNWLFDEDFTSNISFQLTEFISLRNRIDAPHTIRNFNKFLASQKNSLKFLSINRLDVIVGSMEVILTMPRLKELCIKGFDNSHNPIQLENRFSTQNCSVTTLNLDCFFVRNIITLDVILSAFPKIETLILFNFLDEFANVISEKCKSLKNLTTHHFEAQNIADEKFYQNLETFTCSSFVERNSEPLFNKLGVKSTWKWAADSPEWL